MLSAKEFEQFATNWKENPHNSQVTAELVSLFVETNRKVDSYSYTLSPKGELLTSDGLLIRPFIDSDSYLGRQEFAVFEKLEKWTKITDEGVAFWISPPYPDRYPVAKIITHRLMTNGGKKTITNNAILLDISSGEALEIANQLEKSSVSPKAYQTMEETRDKLIILKDHSKWFSTLLSVISDKGIYGELDEETRKSLNEVAKKYTNEIKANVASNKIYNTLMESGYLGSHDISCPPPPTFSEVTTKYSKNNSEGKFVFHCGNCGWPIYSHIIKGYKCPYCFGTYRGC